MNTTSGSHADKLTNELGKILVWDAPVRVFHWLMVICFAGAYITAESESWRLIHVTLGYTMAGLVAFRIIWGVLGTRYARFAAFVRGPKAVANYLRNALHGTPEHSTGHNPAGAIAIVALLVLTIVVTAAGWATYNEIGGDWLEELHEAAANIMLGVVGIHIAGVVVASWMHKENLVRAMFNGRKTGKPADAIRSGWSWLAGLILAVVIGFWWFQWQSAPAADASATQHGNTARLVHDDD